jgi:hypothetical protein
MIKWNSFMADSDFKNRQIYFPDNWTRHSNGGVISSEKYKPDLSFANENGKIVCLLESSSTNDRKVGVGEMCLADKFFLDHKVDGILIFSLCGKSQYRPRPKTQAQYLEPYFRHLKRFGQPHGVRDIYFIDESDFESLHWMALDERFKALAYVLKA